MPPPARKDQGSGIALAFSPRNASQQRALDLFPSSDLLFLLGPAGAGKSMVAMALALNEVREGRASKIFITRPTVSSGERLGALPGTLDEKLAPWLAVLHRLKEKITHKFPESMVEHRAMEYVQGDTFENCVAILDEAQNLRSHELKLYISRAGEGCKMIITGDPWMSFIKPTNKDEYDIDLDSTVDRLQGAPGIGVVEFGDHEVIRSRLAALCHARL